MPNLRFEPYVLAIESLIKSNSNFVIKLSSLVMQCTSLVMLNIWIVHHVQLGVQLCPILRIPTELCEWDKSALSVTSNYMAHFRCFELVPVTCRRSVVGSANCLFASPGRVREQLLGVRAFQFKATEEYVSLTDLRPFCSNINVIMRSVSSTWRRTTWNQGTRRCLCIAARSHDTKSEMK